MINRKIIISSLSIILTLCVLLCYTPVSHSADAYLTIGTGSGSPGSQSAVTVSMENSMNQVAGVQMDICADGGYLSCTGCETAGRASDDFICMANSLKKGCCRVIVSSFVRGKLEEGEGSVLIINYDVSERSPAGECRALNPENVIVADENNQSLVVIAETGEFCFEGGSGDETSTTTTSKIPITTTTILSTKTTTTKTTSDIKVTTIPRTTTTPAVSDITMMPTPGTLTTPKTHTITTTITIREPTTKTKELSESIAEISSKTITSPLSSHYQVFISPSSIALSSGEAVEFRATTIANGQKVKGIYRWELIPASHIGSSINENGLFTAGNNTSSYTIKESVQATDTLHDNSKAIVTVTITIKKPSAVGCTLSISPSSVTLFPGDTITFSAKTFGERCVESSYKWKILSKMDSHISKNGLYTAGNNESGDSAFDIVLVKDTINNISIDAMVTVLSKEKVVQAAPDDTQKPQQRSLFLKVLIIIVLIILTSVVLYWRIKR